MYGGVDIIRKPELLAPVGSKESMRAAINAGADGCYLGGKIFGARAYEKNFENNELIDTINYCHIYGVNVYLTLNTLIKDKEIKRIYDYLLPLYNAGLDAVIVQDIGVVNYLKLHFPKLHLHASTQMNIHQLEGIKFLNNLGINRIVLSRELTLLEIEQLKNNSLVEIECFVHGALCYSYSGQCLMSSILGGRSGNRGKCAQTCRLPYSLMKNNKKIKLPYNYLLSPKDMNTLEIIPELIEVGIDSFKIEGRMKKPEYVAGVTSIYRKWIDYYIEKGIYSKDMVEKDYNNLTELFNRGGFSKGYYYGKTNENMMSMEKPNHLGKEVGYISKIKKNTITINFIDDVHKDDIIVVGYTNECFTLSQDINQNNAVSFISNSSNTFKLNEIIYRTFNAKLNQEMFNKYLSKDKTLKIYGFLICKIGKPIQLTVKYKKVSITSYGSIIDTAKKQPISGERIKEQIQKTGNTEFEFDRLEIEMDDCVFVSIKEINELRRCILEQLRNEILKSYLNNIDTTEDKNIDYNKSSFPYKKEEIIENNKIRTNPNIITSFSNIKLVYTVINIKEIDKIYIDYNIKTQREFIEIVEVIKNKNKKIYMTLPNRFTNSMINRFLDFFNLIEQTSLDGYVIKNYAQYEIVKDSQKDIILDYDLYMYNMYAIHQWNKLGINNFTISPELHYKEIENFPLQYFDIIVYGYIPIMISNQCIINNILGCQKGDLSEHYIEDRYKKKFRVKTFCEDCYNIIYNSNPILLLDQIQKIKKLGIGNIRLNFTNETYEFTSKMINAFVNSVYNDDNELDVDIKEFNRGHFLRGIE